jgi:hypothetical protein
MSIKVNKTTNTETKSSDECKRQNTGFIKLVLSKRRYTVILKYLHAKASYSSLIVCPKLETKNNS